MGWIRAVERQGWRERERGRGLLGSKRRSAAAKDSGNPPPCQRQASSPCCSLLCRLLGRRPASCRPKEKGGWKRNRTWTGNGVNMMPGRVSWGCASEGPRPDPSPRDCNESSSSNGGVVFAYGVGRRHQAERQVFRAHFAEDESDLPSSQEDTQPRPIGAPWALRHPFAIQIPFPEETHSPRTPRAAAGGGRPAARWPPPPGTRAPS